MLAEHDGQAAKAVARFCAVLGRLARRVELVWRVGEHQPLTVAARAMNLASQLTLSCQSRWPISLLAWRASPITPVSE